MLQIETWIHRMLRQKWKHNCQFKLKPFVLLIPGLSQNLGWYPHTHALDKHVQSCWCTNVFGRKDVSIDMPASICDLKKPPTPTPSIYLTAAISCCSNRKDECVIYLPVVVLRLSLHTVSSSLWWEKYQQLSQSDWFKIGTSACLCVHILTQTYEI